MEIVESQDPNRKRFHNALEHFSEWPVVEELGRPAGQTSVAVQEYIHKILGSSPGDRLSQQYVTPDTGTATVILTRARAAGISHEVVDSVYDTLIELELYKANPTGERPLPLSAYPDSDVAAMRQSYIDKIEGQPK